MRTRVAAAFSVCVIVLLTAAAAQAQYRPRGLSDRATGETYHVELGGLFWSPTPDIKITSDEIPVVGVNANTIDFVNDLGIEKERFGQLKVVLRPGTKHKFRFEYTPIRYSAEGTISRNVLFQGVVFPVTLEVETEVTWRAYRFGYEWDFIYRDRGFVGLLLEAKYTDVEASLRNIVSDEFVRARAPIPAIGFIGRGYVTPNVSITGEFSFFKWPDTIVEDYEGKYYDFDLYGTVNFNDHVGAQVGYRSFDVFYKIETDEGALVLKGAYFGGVVRF